MSYTYAGKRQTASTPRQAASAPAAPSLDALKAGTVQPTPELLGRPVDLPWAIRTKMEASFGTDLSAVRLYESQAVADAGANAVTQGSRIAFAPGALDFSSPSGQALLGHELSHVVSQARGEVTGSGFLNDSVLEARADREGAMAAAGQQVYAGPVTAVLSSASAAPAAGPMQASKDSRNRAKLKRTSVPSRAAQQASHTAFTPAQIQKMESTFSGVRGDNTIERHIQPVTNPMRQELGDYIAALDRNRFNYQRGNKNINEWRSGAVGVRYNADSISASQKILNMFSAHLDRPEMAGMLGEIYRHEMANPSKMEGRHADDFDSMEGRYLKNILTKGLIPLGTHINAEHTSNGESQKFQFLRMLQTNTGNLETLYSRKDAEDFPAELKELMESYAPIREKLLAHGRNGLSLEDRNTLRQQYSAPGKGPSSDTLSETRHAVNFDQVGNVNQDRDILMFYNQNMNRNATRDSALAKTEELEAKYFNSSLYKANSFDHSVNNPFEDRSIANPNKQNTGLNTKRTLMSLSGSVGQGLSNEKMEEIFDNLMGVHKTNLSPEEQQAASTNFDTGIRQLKSVYLNHLRRMQDTYGTTLSQLHPEDVWRLLTKKDLDQFAGMQDSEQLLKDFSKYFDLEHNAEDQEFKRLSDYYMDVLMHLSTYPVLPHEATGTAQVDAGMANAFSSSVPYTGMVQREAGINGPRYSDEEMARYHADLRKRSQNGSFKGVLFGRYGQ